MNIEPENYSPVRNRRGVAISGGVGKSLKVNKRGGVAISGESGKSSQVNVYGVGCYKWMWREHQHMDWIKKL